MKQDRLRNRYGHSRSVHIHADRAVHQRVRRVARHGSISGYYSLSAEVTLELLGKAEPNYHHLIALIRRFNAMEAERVVARLERTIAELRDGD